jgi:hypothetical protein
MLHRTIMVSSLEVYETTASSNSIRNRLLSDRVSYQRRMETSATLLQEPKALKDCICQELRFHLSPTFQPTLYHRRGSQCHFPKSQQARQIQKIFLDTHWSSSWNISNLSSIIVLLLLASDIDLPACDLLLFMFRIMVS